MRNGATTANVIDTVGEPHQEGRRMPKRAQAQAKHESFIINNKVSISETGKENKFSSKLDHVTRDSQKSVKRNLKRYRMRDQTKVNWHDKTRAVL